MRKKIVAKDLAEAQKYISVLEQERDECYRDIKAQSKRITELEKVRGASYPANIEEALTCLKEYLPAAIAASGADAARQWSLITISKGLKQL